MSSNAVRLRKPRTLGCTVPLQPAVKHTEHPRIYHADYARVVAWAEAAPAGRRYVTSAVPAGLITAFVTCTFGLLWFAFPLARRH